MKTLKIFIAPTVILMLMMSSLAGCYYDQHVTDLQPIDSGLTVKFSADVIPIFNTSCNVSSCHDGTQPPDLLPENAYEELIGDNLVDVNDPENSELYLWMIGEESIPMPPSGVNPAYNATVLAWIQQGALNN